MMSQGRIVFLFECELLLANPSLSIYLPLYPTLFLIVLHGKPPTHTHTYLTNSILVLEGNEGHGRTRDKSIISEQRQMMKVALSQEMLINTVKASGLEMKQ